jgi:hypothetical protein
MSLNQQYQKLKYIDGFKDRLKMFYGIKDLKSSHRNKLNHEIDGFIEAGLLIRLITKQELQEIIDEQHMDIFGETRQERREKLRSKSEVAEINWDVYDSPAIQRR